MEGATHICTDEPALFPIRICKKLGEMRLAHMTRAYRALATQTEMALATDAFPPSEGNEKQRFPRQDLTGFHPCADSDRIPLGGVASENKPMDAFDHI